MSDRCWRCGRPADYWEAVVGGLKPGCFTCLRDAVEPVSDRAEVIRSTREFIAHARARARDVVEVTLDSRSDGGTLTTELTSVDELERVNEALARQWGMEEA